MRFHLVFLASIAFVTGAGALPQDLPLLTNKDIPQGRVDKTDFYSGEALYGYIDGGADLYFEYGFLKLGRQEVIAGGEKIVVEIYQMKDPLHAFGVFSILRSKCKPVDSTTLYCCESKFQLQAVVGECYTSIINESGLPAARRASIDLFRAIQRKRKAEALIFPTMFQSSLLKSHISNIFVVYGNLGIQNGISEWEPLFREIRSFSVVILPIDSGSQHLSLAHINFASTDDSRTFGRCAGFTRGIDDKLQILHVNDLLRFVLRLGTNDILYVESSPSFPDVESFVRSLIAIQ